MNGRRIERVGGVLLAGFPVPAVVAIIAAFFSAPVAICCFGIGLAMVVFGYLLFFVGAAVDRFESRR